MRKLTWNKNVERERDREKRERKRENVEKSTPQPPVAQLLGSRGDSDVHRRSGLVNKAGGNHENHLQLALHKLWHLSVEL